MPAYKDNNGTWYASYFIKDHTGKSIRKKKRGFKTKRDADRFIAEQKLKTTSSFEMKFGSFVEQYYVDMENRIKLNTMLTKKAIVDLKILPFFEDMKMNEIKVCHVVAWQNELLAYRDADGNPYSPSYLKTVHNQLSAIFNHAHRMYGLSDNPARLAGNMGKEKTKEMKFWTKEEYKKFSEQLMNKTMTYMAFEILYWCGIRLGELLALTLEDIDFENKRLRINKSYQRINRQDVITSPKTEKSNRSIDMPDFLVEEIKNYIVGIYKLKPTDRIFHLSKTHLQNEMKNGAARAGVKRIRIHDLRHSHVSLLIEMGFSALAIAERIGHESIEITYRYAHLFPSKGKEIASRLNVENGVIEDDKTE